MENEVVVKNDLMIPTERINVPDLFSNKKMVESLISAIGGKAREHTPDLSTDASRKAIASNAYRVAQSKTFLDGLGKDFVAARKAEIKNTDSLRKMIRDGLDALRDEVRKPLTDYENAEKERIEREKEFAAFLNDWDDAIAEDDLFNRQREIERKEAELLKQEEERKAQEEVDRIAKEQKEREERIAKEAAEEAEKRAKAAEIETLRMSRLAQLPGTHWDGSEALCQFTNEIVITYKDIISLTDIEFEKVVAFRESQVELRNEREAEISEQRAKEEKEKAVREGEERAKKEAERKEQERIAKERELKEIADRKARHHAHVKRIKKEATQSLVDHGITESAATGLVDMIDKEMIKHISIIY